MAPMESSLAIVALAIAAAGRASAVAPAVDLAPAPAPITATLTPPREGEGASSCSFCPAGLSAPGESSVGDATVLLTTRELPPPAGADADCARAQERAAALAADDAECTILKLGEAACCPAGAPVAVANVVLNVVGSVVDYSAYDDGSDAPADPPAGLSAREIAANAGDSQVLAHVVRGVAELANRVMLMGEAGGGRHLRGTRALHFVASLQPRVTDIACPAGLPYAPAGGLCVEFAVGIVGPEPSWVAASPRDIAARLRAAIDDDGALYDLVRVAHPDTRIIGLGRPGGGVRYAGGAIAATKAGADVPAMLVGGPETEGDWFEEIDPLWVILAAIVAVVILVALAAFVHVRRSRSRGGAAAADRALAGEAALSGDPRGFPAHAALTDGDDRRGGALVPAAGDGIAVRAGSHDAITLKSSNQGSSLVQLGNGRAGDGIIVRGDSSDSGDGIVVRGNSRNESITGFGHGGDGQAVARTSREVTSGGF